MRIKYPTAGQPVKLSRNILVCKLRDEGKTLSELSEIFNIDASRISRIITKFWKEYTKVVKQK